MNSCGRIERVPLTSVRCDAFCRSKRESLLFSTHSKDVVVPSLTHLQVTGGTRPEVRRKISYGVTVWCRSDTCNVENKSSLVSPTLLVGGWKKKLKTASTIVKTLFSSIFIARLPRSRRNDVIFDASFAAEESASYAPPNANSFPGNCAHLSRISSPDD